DGTMILLNVPHQPWVQGVMVTSDASCVRQVPSIGDCGYGPTGAAGIGSVWAELAPAITSRVETASAAINQPPPIMIALRRQSAIRLVALVYSRFATTRSQMRRLLPGPPSPSRPWAKTACHERSSPLPRPLPERWPSGRRHAPAKGADGDELSR